MASHDLDAIALLAPFGDLSVGYPLDTIRSVDYTLAYNDGYAAGYADGLASAPAAGGTILSLSVVVERWDPLVAQLDFEGDLFAIYRAGQNRFVIMDAAEITGEN